MSTMKKTMSLLLALALVFALAACGGTTSGGGTTASPAPESTAPNSAEPADTTSPEPEAAPVEVVVFAAASMEATLTEIALFPVLRGLQGLRVILALQAL